MNHGCLVRVQSGHLRYNTPVSAWIEIKDLTYTHPQASQPTLRGINLEIEEGQWVALLGANGSGKTTLARHLNALLLPSNGYIKVTGLHTSDPQTWPALRSRVGMVFQFPEDQIVAGTVEDDVAFGLENLGLPSSEIRRRVDQALEWVGMSAFRLREPHLLSAGQVQRVALAGVLATQPRVVVFDESTAMLDPRGRREVMAQIRRLRSEGVTVVMITHFMEEAALADRVIVLQQGQVAADGSPRQVFGDPAALRAWGLAQPPAAELAARLRSVWPQLPGDLFTPQELMQALPAYPGSYESPLSPISDPPAPQPPLIEVTDLEYTYLRGTPFANLALRGVSLRAGAGTCHGLAGGTGSGKSTLLQHLNGLNRPQVGRVRVGPFDLNDPQVSTRTVCQTVGLAFQVPDFQLFEQYVGDEIAYGPLQMGQRENLSAQVRQAMERVGLDFAAYKDRLTFTLSGGEKRKVALASALVLQPQVLLLDEPMAGLDPASHVEMLARLREWQQAGMTLVLSSHTMDDLAALGNELTVLQGGLVVLQGPAAEVFAQGAALEAAGLEQPLSMALAEALRARGWPLPAGVCTPAALAAAIAASQGRPL